ncbi:MAG: hypothetical protein IIZ73_06875, partial [Ruminococcus sp.]|nr:hypothetical protein [Ruminococcus sp.]
MSLFGENPVHFAFDISAVIVCMTVLFFSIISRRNEKAQNKIFTALIIIIMMNSVCEIVTNYLVPISGSSQLIFRLMDHTRLLYFLLHAALCPFFFFYVICVCGAVSKIGLKQHIAYSLMFIITEIIVILNPFTHWLYHFDEKSIYHRDKAIYAIYIAAAVYFILA